MISSMFQEDSPQFKWTQSLAGVANQQDDNILFDLSSNNENLEDGKFSNLKPEIQLRKPLNFDNETGWSWHKSWNLPEIEYSLNVQQVKNDDITGKFSAEIFVIKKFGEQNKYKNLGIKGFSKKAIVDGRTEFSCLKFTTTSYNNNHENFFLLIVLFYLDSTNTIRIINGMISPEIFVDSRKYARFHIQKFNQQSFIEPFPPDLLSTIIIKRENKNKEINNITIDDSITGLVNYFTASNIRNKIKHPLFLTLRFSKSVRLYVNKQLMKQPHNLVSLIQKNLSKSISNKSEDKIVKILILTKSDDSSSSKKAIEIIQQLENSHYEIYTQECYLPQDIVQITDLDSLAKQYTSTFKLISSVTQNLSSEDDKPVEKKVCDKQEENCNQTQEKNQSIPTFKDLECSLQSYQVQCKKEETEPTLASKQLKHIGTDYYEKQQQNEQFSSLYQQQYQAFYQMQHQIVQSNYLPYQSYGNFANSNYYQFGNQYNYQFYRY